MDGYHLHLRKTYNYQYSKYSALLFVINKKCAPSKCTFTFMTFISLCFTSFFNFSNNKLSLLIFIFRKLRHLTKEWNRLLTSSRMWCGVMVSTVILQQEGFVGLLGLSVWSLYVLFGSMWVSSTHMSVWVFLTAQRHADWVSWLLQIAHMCKGKYEWLFISVLTLQQTGSRPRVYLAWSNFFFLQKRALGFKIQPYTSSLFGAISLHIYSPAASGI